MGTVDLSGCLARLKQLKPDHILVELNDGTEKEVAVPTIRRKWTHLKATLANIGDWRRIEARDKKGRVLGVIENENVADLEDLEGDEGVDLGAMMSDGEMQSALQPAMMLAPILKQLLALLIKGQDVALMRQERALSKVLDVQVQLLTQVSARLMSQDKLFERNLERTQQYAEALSEVIASSGENQGDPEMMALLAALPKLLARGASMPAAAPPTNGPTPKSPRPEHPMDSE